MEMVSEKFTASQVIRNYPNKKNTLVQQAHPSKRKQDRQFGTARRDRRRQAAIVNNRLSHAANARVVVLFQTPAHSTFIAPLSRLCPSETAPKKGGRGRAAITAQSPVTIVTNLQR